MKYILFMLNAFFFIWGVSLIVADRGGIITIIMVIINAIALITNAEKVLK